MRELPVDAVLNYDKVGNISCWTIKLPRPSPLWTEMTFESHGIFERRVVLEVGGQGYPAWRRWKELHWRNLSNVNAEFHVGLEGLPKDAGELRITISHGDNKPIDIRRTRLVYYSQTLLFLINKPGEYTLYGGNREAPEARYDLALVQAHLMETAPRTAVMERPVPLRRSFVSLALREAFYDKDRGLYAVLCCVTLVLMVLIVRLFPKDKRKD